MEFRTPVAPLKGLEGVVGYGAPVVFIGSCFSDNLGAELQADLFDAVVNPFGPLYNPLSIQRAVESLAHGSQPEFQLFENEGRWHSLEFHSRFSAATSDEARRLMSRSVSDGADALKRASAVFITLGTTTVYLLKATGLPVANCHKLPQSRFDLKHLSLDECKTALRETMSKIREINPDAWIIFTVSPLRYLQDGQHANTLIKSILHLAIQEVLGDRVGYFPSYEIMMDDLRDYRFYADDMKHPSALAVRYIYEIFTQSYMTPETVAVAREGRRLSRRLAHRDFSSQNTSVKELELLDRYPQLRCGYNRLYANR